MITVDRNDKIETTNSFDFVANGSTVVNPLNQNVPKPARHLLQPTDFSYSDASDIAETASGQIGFGGVLRLGFGNIGLTDTDLGKGNIGIGDFTLSYNAERMTTGATGASGWVIKTTTGISNSNHPARNCLIYPMHQ